MNTDNIFPRILPGTVITPEASAQPYDGYTILADGTTIRLRGDGTGTAEDGTDYTCVSRGVGTPDDDGNFDEYEVIGWVESWSCHHG